MLHFHLFPMLPEELRALVWSFAALPRRVHIKEEYLDIPGVPFSNYQCIVSPTPPPAVMHTCRESRQGAPYTRAFVCMEGPVTPRYIWVNFAVDTLCVQARDYHYQSPRPGYLGIPSEHEHQIERLEVNLTWTAAAETFRDWFRDTPRRFPLLKEMQVQRPAVVDEEDDPSDILTWTAGMISDFTSCPEENIRFVDARSGLVWASPELQAFIFWKDGQRDWEGWTSRAPARIMSRLAVDDILSSVLLRRI